MSVDSSGRRGGAGGVLWCRPGLEDALIEELRDRSRGKVRAVQRGRGVVEGSRGRGRMRPARYTFEHGRIEQASFFPAEELNPVSEKVLEAIARAIGAPSTPWRFAFEFPQGDAGLQRRSRGFARAVDRVLPRQTGSTRASAVPPGSAGGFVLPVLYTEEGAWISCRRQRVPAGPGASAPRLRRKTHTPSRSALKLEEAFYELGLRPRAGESVVDLGAAPGGWSAVCLALGCRVTAVDRGPLKIGAGSEAPATLVHLRRDGLRYAPSEADRPVDWMIADMLIPPGAAMGLLRKWCGRRWARRVICNVKLPQTHPYAVVRELERSLNQVRLDRWRVLHLRHDRREVTVLARVCD